MAILSDETWMRHANPWSVWTRYATFPVLIAAIWSRTWLGWWALAPFALVVAWLIWNPRAFSPPRSLDNWASKAVLGERIWTSLRSDEVPARHRMAPRIAGTIATSGMLALLWGLYVYDLVVTALGAIIVLLAKTWFNDRMVWLYEDMKGTKPEHRAWLS